MINRFEQFSYVISGINRYIQKIERDEMVKYGYKGSFAQYLAILAHYPDGLTMAKICELCDRDKAAVSRVFAEMTEKGLVEKITDNEKVYGGRFVLTEEGEKVSEFVAKRAKTAVSVAGAQMTEEERKLFYATLDFIAEKLEFLAKEGLPKD